MIEVRDVSKEYNGTPVLNHVNMKLKRENLLPLWGHQVNVFDNIALALTLSGTKYMEIKKQVEEIS